MASEVSICSNALMMLGDRPINSFDEGAQVSGIDRAKLAGNLWPTVRDSMLRSHPWNCAVKRISLTPEITTPAFEFSQQFILPSDWLRNVEINGVHETAVDYRVESRRLLLSQSILNLRYIYRNKDIDTWDAMLIQAAELAMAARMAYAVTGKASLKKELESELSYLLSQARAVDGQDESPAVLGSFEILTARRSINV